MWPPIRVRVRVRARARVRARVRVKARAKARARARARVRARARARARVRVRVRHLPRFAGVRAAVAARLWSHAYLHLVQRLVALSAHATIELFQLRV